jgi:hypothetical protein
MPCIDMPGIADEHECAFEGRPLAPERTGESWDCPVCGWHWVAMRGDELPRRPRWVEPGSLGWVHRREPS